MTAATLTAVLRRDRAMVVIAIVVITALAWVYILWLAAQMRIADVSTAGAADGAMAGMYIPGGSGTMADIGAGVEPAFRTWSVAEFAFTFSMWAAMMVGMMMPSVAPMVLLYDAVSRKSRVSARPLSATSWFVAGYLSAWIVFSLAATGAQWALTRLALLTPMMASANGIFGGIVLIAAGLYQWTTLKDTCLRQCRTPLGFLMSHGDFRSDPFGATRLGTQYGAYCVGCCWVLMTLLFVGGIMNVLWIAGLTMLILLEKVAPTGRLIPRVTGAVIAAAGVFLLVRPF